MTELNRTNFGEYDFGNYGSVDVLLNSGAEEVYYTEAHEYIHRKLAGQTTSGIFLMLMRRAGKYSDKHLALEKDMKDKKRFTHEAMATFYELCLVYYREGQESFDKKVSKLKKENREYYKYFRSLEFLLEHMDHKSASELAELLAITALNIDIKGIPVKAKERKKFFSSRKNSMKYLPNTRFKELCKATKQWLCKDIDNDTLQKIVDGIAVEIDIDEEYVENMEEYVLELFKDDRYFDQISDSCKVTKNHNEIDPVLMIYPTLLNINNNPKNFPKIDDWRELYTDLSSSCFPMIIFNSAIQDGFYPIITSFINEVSERKLFQKYIFGVNENDIQDFLQNLSSPIMLIGNIDKAENFKLNQLTNIELKSFLFIDIAIVDSIEYINKYFEGGYFRIFNYMNTFSILVAVKDGHRLIQPVSINAYDSIQSLVIDKKLKLNNVEIKSNDLDEHIIQSVSEKKELDLLISIIYLNLFED